MPPDEEEAEAAPEVDEPSALKLENPDEGLDGTAVLEIEGGALLLEGT